MKKIYSVLIFILFVLSAHATDGIKDIMSQDTNDVKRLNKQAYESRLTNPEQAINIGNKSLALAIKLNYSSGIAEAYRVTGIGQYYFNIPQEAITSYINALNYFTKDNNLR